MLATLFREHSNCGPNYSLLWEERNQVPKSTKNVAIFCGFFFFFSFLFYLYSGPAANLPYTML
jgi:hypothetical protein